MGMVSLTQTLLVLGVQQVVEQLWHIKQDKGLVCQQGITLSSHEIGFENGTGGYDTADVARFVAVGHPGLSK